MLTSFVLFGCHLRTSRRTEIGNEAELIIPDMKLSAARTFTHRPSGFSAASVDLSW